MSKQGIAKPAFSMIDARLNGVYNGNDDSIIARDHKCMIKRGYNIIVMKGTNPDEVAGIDITELINRCGRWSIAQS